MGFICITGCDTRVTRFILWASHLSQFVPKGGRGTHCGPHIHHSLCHKEDEVYFVDLTCITGWDTRIPTFSLWASHPSTSIPGCDTRIAIFILWAAHPSLSHKRRKITFVGATSIPVYYTRVARFICLASHIFQAVTQG